MTSLAQKQQNLEAQLQHQELLADLDIHGLHKTFRSAAWKPSQRRNKGVKAILSEASRRDAANNNNNNNTAANTAANTANNSAAPTPRPEDEEMTDVSRDSTPAPATNAHGNATTNGNAYNMSKMVLEKNHQASTTAGPTPQTPAATYTNIASAPSFAPTRWYCDVTGLRAPYMDPKSRLRYHNAEVFAFVRSLPQGVNELYLEARGAHTILK